VILADPRAKGDADSRSDSNTGTYQANPARPDDHRYQLDHVATHACPVLIRMRSMVQAHLGPPPKPPQIRHPAHSSDRGGEGAGGALCRLSSAQLARLHAAPDKGPTMHGWADGHVAGVDVGDDVQVVHDVGRAVQPACGWRRRW
jgi:hypothetical protein